MSSKLTLSKLLTVAAILTVGCGPLVAQSGVRLPSQLFGSHQVFISNQGGVTNSLSQLAYVDLYEAMSHMPSLHLVAEPSQADVIFEISAESYGERNNHGVTSGSPVLHLTIRDLKTHVALWSFTEVVPNATPLTFVPDKNVDDTVRQLLNDFTQLSHEPIVDRPEKKARFSEER